jgi:hypothetical protein
VKVALVALLANLRVWITSPWWSWIAVDVRRVAVLVALVVLVVPFTRY